MTTYNNNLLNKHLFDSLDQFYTDLLLKSCQGRQKLFRLLALQKIAQSVKSCSKLPSTIYLCLAESPSSLESSFTLRTNNILLKNIVSLNHQTQFMLIITKNKTNFVCISNDFAADVGSIDEGSSRLSKTKYPTLGKRWNFAIGTCGEIGDLISEKFFPLSVPASHTIASSKTLVFHLGKGST